VKTLEQLQEAVDELRDVCRRHGVAIVGTCESEGIYGEITIGEANEDALGWSNVAGAVDNLVVEGGDGCFFLGGIGDISTNG